ncbi:MAG: sulfotransferase [Planctomycetes bacterium]|nr:sulfotransferase [Planctomycetota bacterium]NOG54253.1 sulfotransferase [Planctomycetota bacterium]
MRIPGPFERTLWQFVWGRNPLTLGIIAVLPHPRVDRPIFILGSPRSGTSVFSRLFGQHPQLANWSEGHCLFDPMYFSRTTEHRWTDEDASWIGSRRLRANVGYFTKYMRFRQRLPICRFTNKLPRNTLRVPYLLKAFPDAQFVHIIRDGRAVVRSMIRAVERQSKQDRVLGAFARPPGWQDYYQKDPYEAHSRQWVGIESTVQQDLAAIPADRIFRTRYEEFIIRTRGIMKDVCEQFGLRTDDKAINRWPEHLENRNVKWSRECSPEQIETMRAWLTPLLIEYGYVQDVDWPVPNPDDKVGMTQNQATTSSDPAAGTAEKPTTPVPAASDT